MADFWGKTGLFAYSAIATIAANIQVLKLTKYSRIDNPVALGTVLFSTIFVVDNILMEYYGAKNAQKCVWLSFLCYLFFSLIMKITILHPVISHSECINLHQELKNIFSPCFPIFISSAVSYIIGQYADIYIFSALKKLTNGKYVSGRSFISMAISSLVDNCIFSFLAWVILAENPVSLSSLWKTYIVITYTIRLIIVVSCVPLVKLFGVVILRKFHV
ncbi:MAG: queuosine precursor transporter [Holosporaceae bacterium]|jgi:uncharacterized integral membrane protein (TIGR00697 family)|nr:queuosine precursor transporter [Holosporaceae bacterium]